MAEIIHETDLPSAIQSHELIVAMVAGANARATRVAPCLAESATADQVAEARLVLIGAVKRWAEASSGALASQQAGPFGMTVDTRQRTGYNLWPSEIEALQDICRDPDDKPGAFSVDTAPPLDGYAESPDWWGYETTDGSRVVYEG